MNSGYDRIAQLYERNWHDWYLPAAMPVLERLFFEVVPGGSRVLDVCCGPGHVTAELLRRKYVVHGVDASEPLIDIARSKLPDASFSVQDARVMSFPEPFDAALCTFDSLNHLLSSEDLASALQRIHAALHPGSLFVFDMNLEDAYFMDLRPWNATVEEDSIALVRGLYDSTTKLGRTEIIWMRRNGNHWQRTDTFVDERCYPDTEVMELLESAGFQAIERMPAIQAGMAADVGYGRMFFRARA